MIQFVQLYHLIPALESSPRISNLINPRIPIQLRQSLTLPPKTISVLHSPLSFTQNIRLSSKRRSIDRSNNKAFVVCGLYSTYICAWPWEREGGGLAGPRIPRSVHVAIRIEICISLMYVLCMYFWRAGVHYSGLAICDATIYMCSI